ncbi:GH32 C-terminal domain-containing protein [Paenibacillus macquariensis]|uniref:GH32 C-terminal domain-containing protein n=1 Tax=Paenibacillus macquariensis TaxID=948756 RepID=UPI0011159A61|nr:GH32 C-terminal domain-containing protein [Paenibacillus macquariensis]
MTLSEDRKVLMNPVEELKLLCEAKHLVCKDQKVNGSHFVDVTEQLLEVKVVFNIEDTNAEAVGLKIRGVGEQETVIRYNIANQKLTLDCSKSGKPVNSV